MNRECSMLASSTVLADSDEFSSAAVKTSLLTDSAGNVTKVCPGFTQQHVWIRRRRLLPIQNSKQRIWLQGR